MLDSCASRRPSVAGALDVPHARVAELRLVAAARRLAGQIAPGPVHRDDERGQGDEHGAEDPALAATGVVHGTCARRRVPDLHDRKGVEPTFQGNSSNAAMCRGRTTLKWRRSMVATWVTFRRSAAAMTEASAVPSGRSW